MFSFFRAPIRRAARWPLSPRWGTNPAHRTLVTQCAEFPLACQPDKTGKIMRISFPQQMPVSIPSMLQYLQTEVAAHPDSLFVMTTPTELSKEVYAGHNCTFITNTQGEIEFWMSKRPDTKNYLAVRERIPVSWLTKHSETVGEFAPLFNSIPEELATWAMRGQKKVDYSLYFHIIPLLPGLGIDKESYKRNVDEILQLKAPYKLLSWVHPVWDCYFPANNCNHAAFESIFPTFLDNRDMTTQEVAIIIGLKFTEDKKIYLDGVEKLELNKGIDSPTVTLNCTSVDAEKEETYQQMFHPSCTL